MAGRIVTQTPIRFSTDRRLKFAVIIGADGKVHCEPEPVGDTCGKLFLMDNAPVRCTAISIDGVSKPTAIYEYPPCGVFCKR